MKYKICVLGTLISLILFSCSISNEIKNDLEKQNLQGKVKSITQNTFNAIDKFGEIVKGEKYFNKFIGETSNSYSLENSYTEFNKNGFLIKSLESSWVRFFYDKNNRLIEDRYYHDGFITYNSNKYKYDEKGLLLEINSFSNQKLDSLIFKKKYIYDIEGNNIEQNFYNSKGELDGKSKIKYHNNEIVEIKNYNEDGTCWNKDIYDENGNVIVVDLIDDSGKIFLKKESEYNEKNLIVELKNIHNNGTKIIEYKTEYKYTKFDSNDNWIERIEYDNGKPIYIVERKIEYYK